MRVVGRGAFGRVLEVRDEDGGGEPRALKLVPPGPHEAMLLDEFAQLARLRHASLPRVFEVGRTREPVDDIPAGAPFFVAEWIAGARCDEAPTTTTIPLWSLLADIAGALATIHAGGLVHADVAPQNILIGPDGRAVLVDLGLAGARTDARGTPAYMAPEAFAGGVEPRSDLYGLGAVAIRLATGRPPFEGATLGELVQRIVAGARATSTLPALPAPLADLVVRLTARDADARPPSALAVLAELDQLAAALAPGSARLARPRVGAPPAAVVWPRARAWIDDLSRALRGPHAAVVAVGEPASGVRQLVDAAIGACQLDDVARGGALATTLPIASGTLDEVGARLGVAAPSASPHGWIERVARAARAAAARVVIELDDDPRAAELLRALARSPGERPVVAIVERELPAPAEIASVRAPVLDVDDVAQLAAAMLDGPRPSVEWSRGLHAASGGQPLAVIELVRSIAGERDPLAIDWTQRTSAGSAELRARRLRDASPGAVRVAAALAAWGGRAPADRVLATARVGAESELGLAEVVELERLGLVQRHGVQLAMHHAATVAVELVVGGELLGALADAALASGETAAPLFDRAMLDAPRAAQACDVAEELLAHGRPDRALELATRAIASAPARAHLVAARAATAAAAYQDAIGHARAALGAGADPIVAELARARAHQRAGELDLAEDALAALHRAHPTHGEVAGTYARLLVTRARYAEAKAVAGEGTGTLRAEAAGLAAFYLGDLDGADAAFAALERAGDAVTVGRALSLRGMVAQQRGQLAVASERYREAARRLADAGELHAAATAEVNLGTVLSERGRASEALPRLAAAGRVFAELGATTELIGADLNRGSALVAVGQHDEARAAAEAALARAGAGAPHLRAFALIVAGDARRGAGGDDAGALRCYREALAIGRERGDAHAQVSAYIALAEAGQHDHDHLDIDALCASADDRDRWTLARSRLALVDGTGDWVALARACAEVAARAGDADRLERAFRGHALAAQLAHRARDAGLARSEAERAHAAHAALVAAAAPAFRAALADDADLARLAPDEPEPARELQPPQQHTYLRRLLTLSRRLNSEASVERILDEAIDTAIELTDAERGFLLLRQTDGTLAPVVSRNFVGIDLDGVSPAAAVSRSIAERAAQTGEVVVTVDAGVDARFGAAVSVAALRLRSVLAVPLRQRGTITGCIYLDHRLRGGAFDDTAAAMLGELADIAAIAIENARLTTDLRSTSHEVDQLNARLSAELAERDAELVRVKAELPDRDRLRHRYERIIGRSPAMVRMLEMVDRAAATALPVVIVGESGTGKELVARALHDNGPRKAGPFVALNCSAVPEQLLESELFGHVRGAFTGAERDRRGLFEVADTGTLFLDEIAETGMAMQAKLLRVLQDGLVRRVGDTRTRKVDVRVVAASQRALADLVTAGRFREDLRYRLEVIAISVPVLRDREGDVPLLVEQILARLCPDRPPPRLTRAALRALGQHSWPGNVRELENALARGVAMGGDVIDLGDLPESIAHAAGRPEPGKPAIGDDLRLKPALAATEQAYISAAMARAKNNQTVAARLLGLSRFGLQKKLRRLAGEDDGQDD